MLHTLSEHHNWRVQPNPPSPASSSAFSLAAVCTARATVQASSRSSSGVAFGPCRHDAARLSEAPADGDLQGAWAIAQPPVLGWVLPGVCLAQSGAAPTSSGPLAAALRSAAPWARPRPPLLPGSFGQLKELLAGSHQ